MIMPEQPPTCDDSNASASLPGQADEGPADSTQSNVVAFKRTQYSVGYGRPPLHSRFKPSQSGNPKGRPKGSCNLKTKLKNVYTAKMVIHEGGKKRHVTRIEALLLAQSQRGMKGNERATQAAIANAKALGVFDEPETDEGARADYLSDETIKQLSLEAVRELIEIERARQKKALN
jgi:hypothetical protein